MDRDDPRQPVVLHVDLDCFYAIVEHARLGIPLTKPLAVQQWESLIAVNYAARAAGVARHDRVSEALRKCPELQLVHVETIGNDQRSGVAVRRENAKVSLERYRQASKFVFDIFHQHADVCERASIDEAYLDVSKKVQSLLNEDYDLDKELDRLLQRDGMIIEHGSLELSNSVDKRLLIGAIIAERIRNDVRSKLGYTCSVGIATNKLLAKIASARHKPDQQTLILPNGVTELMHTLPLKKVKLLGGKIGEELSEKWNCSTAGDAQNIPLRSLVLSFGDRLGNYLYKAVRGIHEDKIQEKQTTKSMLAAKSFQATRDIAVVRKWLGVLAEELSQRMLRDATDNHRLAHTLQLYYRSRQGADRSRSCSMPHSIIQLLGSQRVSNKESNRPESPSIPKDSACTQHVEGNSTDMDLKTKELAKLLEQAALHLFQSVEDALPCTRLAIAASGFEDTPVQGSQSIQHFFANAMQAKKDPSLAVIPKPDAASMQSDVLNSASRNIHHFLANAMQTKKSISFTELTVPNALSAESDLFSSVREVDDNASLASILPEDIVIENGNLLPNCTNTIERVPDESFEHGLPSGHTLDTGSCVDLNDIDVEEQRRILEQIYSVRSSTQNSSGPMSTQRFNGNQALKRRKVVTSSSKSGQATLSRFFSSTSSL